MDLAAIVQTEGMRPLLRVEYDRLVALGFLADEPVELLHGVIVPTSPQGTRHAWTVRRLTELLTTAVAGAAQVHVQSLVLDLRSVEFPFAASDDSEPEPDVAVVPIGDWLDDHPDRAFLVVEVSESSHRRDLGAKVELYAASAVQEYWVVDLVTRTVVAHSAPSGGRFGTVATRTEADTLTLAALPGVQLPVAALLPPLR